MCNGPKKDMTSIEMIAMMLPLYLIVRIVWEELFVCEAWLTEANVYMIQERERERQGKVAEKMIRKKRLGFEMRKGNTKLKWKRASNNIKG